MNKVKLMSFLVCRPQLKEYEPQVDNIWICVVHLVIGSVTLF